MLSKEVKIFLQRGLTPEERLVLATVTQNSESLSLFSVCQPVTVKAAVASNPYTPEIALTKLYDFSKKNNENSIKLAICQNSNAPCEILQNLDKEEAYFDFEIAKKIIGNPQTDYDTLMYLCKIWDF